MIYDVEVDDGRRVIARESREMHDPAAEAATVLRQILAGQGRSGTGFRIKVRTKGRRPRLVEEVTL